MARTKGVKPRRPPSLGDVDCLGGPGHSIGAISLRYLGERLALSAGILDTASCMLARILAQAAASGAGKRFSNSEAVVMTDAANLMGGHLDGGPPDADADIVAIDATTGETLPSSCAYSRGHPIVPGVPVFERNRQLVHRRYPCADV